MRGDAVITGCYDMSAEEYHGDPCSEPSLSRSIIHALVPPTGTPLHAAHKHPKIYGSGTCRVSDRAMQIGSACHALMFGEEARISIIVADDYKKKATKEQRLEAELDGLLPILIDDYEKALAMVVSGRQQLNDAGETAFTNGEPERTLIWQEENGVWCRARLDWCPTEPGRPIDDYKTTAGSASAEIWSRAMFSVGDDIQAAFYTRGWRTVFGADPGPFRFIVQEQSPPYAINVINGLTGRAMENANRKIEHAIRTWRKCLDSGKWPGYTMGYQVDVPTYREFFFEEEA